MGQQGIGRSGVSVVKSNPVVGKEIDRGRLPVLIEIAIEMVGTKAGGGENINVAGTDRDRLAVSAANPVMAVRIKT